MNETVETVAELDEAIAVDESGEVSQEDKALVLLEVIQAAISYAVDAGMPVEIERISLVFLPEGDVSVVAVGEDGVEVQQNVPQEEIVDLLAL